MAQTDPDGRPRPQYGEYASAQEQRSHIREPQRVDTPVPSPAAEAVVASDAASGAPRVKVSATGRVATVLLLVYGAANVLITVPSLLDLAAAITPTYHRLGIPGTFTNVGAAHTWGIAAAAVLIVGFLVTVWLAVRRLRRARSAWWIPLVGAAVTYIVVFACLAVPLLGDPSFAAYVQQGR